MVIISVEYCIGIVQVFNNQQTKADKSIIIYTWLNNSLDYDYMCMLAIYTCRMILLKLPNQGKTNIPVITLYVDFSNFVRSP